LLELSDDAVLLVRKARVAIRDRGAARAELLTRGVLDDLQSHFLAHRAPPGFVWAVLVEADHVRLVLHSLPLAASEAA
jgi:hypothetical protein